MCGAVLSSITPRPVTLHLESRASLCQALGTGTTSAPLRVRLHARRIYALAVWQQTRSASRRVVLPSCSIGGTGLVLGARVRPHGRLTRHPDRHQVVRVSTLRLRAGIRAEPQPVDRDKATH